VNQNATLELHIRLLVAQYGKRRVLESLAGTQSVDVTEIERDIERLEANAKRKKQRPKKSLTERLQDAHLSDPAAKSALDKLVYRYDAQEFLPNLRDVKRFLESMGVEAGKVRSRLDALPKVIKVLANQPGDQLQTLLEESLTSGRSDLGMITDQILGESKFHTDD